MFTIRERFRQFRELSRLFFGRFLENDLVCVDGDTRATLAGIVSLLIAPGVFLPLIEYIAFSSYPLGYKTWMVRDLAAIPDKTLHIGVSMTVLALVTIFEWDAMLPDRRDVAVLRPLPLGVGSLFAAKTFALLQFWAIFTLAVGAAPSILFPAAVVQKAPDGVLAMYIRSHATTVLAANLFVFLALIAIPGFLMSLLGAVRFRRFAPYAQFACVAAVLGMFFLSMSIVWRVNLDQPPSRMADALPVFWFVGLEQQLLGWKKPWADQLAAHVAPALLIAALVAAVAYAASYRKSVASAFEAPVVAAAAPGRLFTLLMRLANRFLLRGPAECAAFHFVWQTVARSRSHRLLVAGFAAFGAGLIFQSITGLIAYGNPQWWREREGPLLIVPFVLPLFIATGLRYAFTVPAEFRANWLFQMGCGAPEDYLAGARKAAHVLTLAPIFLLLPPVYFAAWGFAASAAHILFGAVVAWLLVEGLMAGLEKLPFTCSYVPGKANVKSCWTFYLMAYLLYVAALSWVGLKILANLARLAWVAMGAALVYAAIRRYRRRRTAFGFDLVFDETPAPAVQTLGLTC